MPTDRRALLEQAEVIQLRIAKQIDEQMPKGWGFCLIFGSYGDGGFATWTSSVEREGAARMIRELLHRWEAEGSIQKGDE